MAGARDRLPAQAHGRDGGKPMLWDIMNICARQGYCDFLIARGYDGEVIKSTSAISYSSGCAMALAV